MGKTSFLLAQIVSLQSIVHLVFRDEKDPRTECEHWQYWHSQQPNPQQRAFDIGRLDWKLKANSYVGSQWYLAFNCGSYPKFIVFLEDILT